MSGAKPTHSGTNLLLATSLCSGQIARLAAESMQREQRAAGRELRFTHLPPQTEGCGGGPYETVMPRVLIGHLRHPLVEHCYVLEHGCEKTHNDWLRLHLAQRGLNDDMDRYGWGSVQGDGGVSNVVKKVSQHFNGEGGERLHPRPRPAGAAAPLTIGIVCADAAPAAEDLRGLAALVLYVAGCGGTVLIPKHSALLKSPAFRADTLFEQDPTGSQPATLAYAEAPARPGLHVVEQTDAQSWVETVTGLGAAGCGLILSWLGRSTGLRPGHPFIPTVHAAVRDAGHDNDCDIALTPADAADPVKFVRSIVAASSTACAGTPTKTLIADCVDYAIPRELAAVSL